MTRNVFLVAVGLYLTSALIAFRNFLINPGVIGHQWDWFVPPFSEYLKYISSTGPYLWQETYLGSPLAGYQLPSNLLTSMLSTPGYLNLQGDSISKLIPLFIVTLSGCFMFIMMRGLLSEIWFYGKDKDAFILNFSAFLSGFFYAFSPFVFCDLIGGAVSLLVAYSFVPLAIDVGRRLFATKKIIFAWVLALTLSIILVAIPYLIIVILLLFLYMFLYPNRTRLLRLFLVTGVIFVLLNAYWIVPFLMNVLTEHVTESGIYSQLFAKEFLVNRIRRSIPSMWQLFVGDGYFDRHWFIEAVDPTLRTVWFLSSYAWVGLLIGVPLLMLRSVKMGLKHILFWISLFLIAIAIAAGGNSPIGPLVEVIYVEGIKSSLLAPFRSTIRLLMLPALTLAIVLGIGTYTALHLLSFDKKGRKFLLAVALILIEISVWLHPFFFSGDLGYSYLKHLTPGNQVSMYTLSPGYQKAFSILNSDNDNYRVLSLPMVYSPLFNQTEFQNIGQGGDPLVVYSPHPMPVEESEYLLGKNAPLNSLQRFIYFEDDLGNLTKLSSLFSIKYVMLRKDIYPYFSPYRDRWNYTRIEYCLKKNDRLELLVDEDYVLLFLNRDFVPPIYGAFNVKLPESKWIINQGKWQIMKEDLSVPEFETGEKNGWESGGKGTWEVQSATVWNGSYSAKISTIANYGYWIRSTTRVGCQPGQIIEFSSVMKADENISTSHLMSDFFSAEGGYFKEIQSPNYGGNYNWTLQTFRTIAPEGAAYYSPLIYFGSEELSRGGTGYIDDVRFPYLQEHQPALKGELESILTTNRIYSNFTLEATLTLEKGSNYNAYVLWRMTEDMNNYYYAGIEGKMWFVVGKKIEGIRTQITSQSGIPIGSDVHIRILSYGNEFQILYRIDYDLQWKTVQFYESTIKSGYIAIHAMFPTIYRDIKIGSDANNMTEYRFNSMDDIDIPLLVNSEDFVLGKSAFFELTQNEGKGVKEINEEYLRNAGSKVDLSYIRLNPTKYVVDVKTDTPFYLIFSQNYNDQWVATINYNPVKYHFIANGYSNAWFINKTGYFQIIIEYEPQKYVNIGLIISLFALVLSTVYVLISIKNGRQIIRIRIRLFKRRGRPY